jgi:hypothetical protein
MMQVINIIEAQSCTFDLINRIALDGLQLEDWLA